VTISVVDQPFALLVLDICAEAGLAVVAPPDSDKPVTADLVEVPADVALRMVAEPLGYVPVIEEGSVRFVLRDRVRGDFMVLPALLDGPQSVTEAVRAVVTDESQVVAVGDRVLVSGPDRDLDRALELEAHLSAGGPDGWLIRVWLVDVSKSLRTDLGLAWGASVDAALGVDGAVGAFARSPGRSFVGARARAAVDVLGRAVQDGRQAESVAEGTLFVLEGTVSELQQGDVVPIAQRQTSPEGTTTIVGYQFIRTGFLLSVSASRVPEGVRLVVTPSLSAVTGFVADEAPITTERRVTGTAVVSDGDYLILSGLDRLSLSETGVGTPGLPSSILFSSSQRLREESSLLVVLHAQRVKGGA
jgi:hypothetical protein